MPARDSKRREFGPRIGPQLWYHRYEAADPGWWQRTNGRLLKEQGRTMQGYVPGQDVPWMPFAVGAH
jgi:hypothetical protein